MKKLITIFIILVLNNGFVFGQQTTIEKTSQIKISPFRVMDLVNPGFEIGFEKFYEERHSSQISVACLSDVFKLTQFTNYSGFRISFEQKFFKSLSTDKRGYFAIEPVFLKVNYFDEGQFIKDTALNTPEYWDTFKVAKQTISLNLKYGVQIYLKNFVVDVSIGLGVKYKQVKRNELMNKNAYEVPSRHPNAYFEASRGGNYITANVPMNIQIGYNF